VLTAQANGTTTITIDPTDDLGLQDRASTILNVPTATGTLTVGTQLQAPTAAFSANVTTGEAPLAVQFTDESSGAPTAWSWTFGDGSTSTAQHPAHTYTAAGTYTVNLTVTNAGGSDDELKTDYITVTAPANLPTAAFSANVTSGMAPLTVAFMDESTGDAINAWAWDFDNDNDVDSTEQNPVYTYATAGIYSVKLTVTNASGSDVELKTNYITVTAEPTAPTAAFSATPTTGVAPLAVTFTDASTGVPTAWAWDFDNDGDVDSTTQNPTYTYTTAGTYTVNLTVTNALGSDSEVKTNYITVTEPSGSQPFPGPHVPSARIEAEDFDQGGEGVAYHDTEPANLGNSNHRPGEGVDIETENGITDVGWIRAGEYLKYSIDTTAAGNFTLTLRAANPDATAKAVKVSVDGTPVTQVSIGGTGAFTTYQDFTSAAPIAIGQGRHVVTLSFENINRINLDWLTLTAAPVSTLPQTTPYGPGNNIPGRVQAENFDKNGVGAANAAFSDTTAINEGGAYRPNEAVDIEYTASIASYDVGWIRTGEYLIYTVQVASDGEYTAQFNAANPDATSKAIDVFVDGTKVGTAQIGTTGAFETFKKFSFTLGLTEGKHQIKLAFPSQRLNLDYIEFAKEGTQPGGGASFVAVPTTASHGSAFKFTVTPAAGKTIKSAWWAFDYPGHKDTWNSRVINPTFFYYVPGTYSPYVELTYTDGTTEAVGPMTNYIKST
jgi:PKD repeat protein